MKTALSGFAQRRCALVISVGLLMAVVFFSPSLSGAQNTCPDNPSVASSLTQCVTDDVTDCPTLSPANRVDTLQEAVVAAAANSPNSQVIGVFINTEGACS
jgi:hypothetical protein